MNRLHHVKQTLLTNIIDNEGYGNVEFILLDYNSSDHLDDYISDNLMKYIKSGVLKYYKTDVPLYFNRSHSRNVAFRLASGDIICNLDVDNFTGQHFASYVDEEFTNNAGIFLSNIGTSLHKDVLGRICVRRDDFYEISGYDERIINYGFEDYDLANRLEMVGLKKCLFKNEKTFFNTIFHERTERLSNEFVFKNLFLILVAHLTPASTDLIFLFNNKTFKRYIYVDHQTFNYPEPISEVEYAQLDYRYSLTKAPFTDGTWIENSDGFDLFHQKEFCLVYNKDKDRYENLIDSSINFLRVTDPGLIQEFMMIYSAIPNRIIMAENLLEGKAAINGNQFGIEKLYKNFNSQSFTLI